MSPGSFQAKSGARIDRLLKAKFPGLSGSQLEEAIHSGLVVGWHGGKVKKGSRVTGIEALDVSRLERHLTHLSFGNPALELTIEREEETWLAVDKPAGMPSHPVSLFDENTITQWLFAQYPATRREFPDPQPTVTPHRLDTETSGILIVAKTQLGFSLWRTRFQNKQVTKKYLAWCWGKPDREEFTVRYSVAHSSTDRSKMVAVVGEASFVEPVLEATSHVKILQRLEKKGRSLGIFLAEIDCETGVTHQVRVHLASQGYPLLGDRHYDPQFGKRPMLVESHQLRATELVVEGHVIQAEPSLFVEGIVSRANREL